MTQIFYNPAKIPGNCAKCPVCHGDGEIHKEDYDEFDEGERFYYSDSVECSYCDGLGYIENENEDYE